ncbi:hypothetical protein [Agrococcus sp. SGAir0287]|uniref:hypothetical protein n=1 Tax=Agrococcus sp. SGAir0287 TaxID=2070347 RepID=UPI001586E963|nr:hypothetical protein [Agrococcus sp. SGAir0287]
MLAALARSSTSWGGSVLDRLGGTVLDRLGGTVLDRLGGTVLDRLDGTVLDRLDGTVLDQLGWNGPPPTAVEPVRIRLAFHPQLVEEAAAEGCCRHEIRAIASTTGARRWR